MSILVGHIWGTYDHEVFEVICTPLGTLVSKGVKFGILVMLFDLVVNFILGLFMHFSQLATDMEMSARKSSTLGH